ELFLCGLFIVTAQLSLLAGAIPLEDHSVVALRSGISHSTNIEERQTAIVVVGAAIALGVIAGRWAQSNKDAVGLNQNPGSNCFQSGSWTKQDRILSDMVPPICDGLVARALTWQKDNSEPNPYYAPTMWSDGTYLLNEDGFRQSLTFGMIDENGERGKSFYTKEACVVAFTTILYDCVGSNSDTRGGVHFFGHDAVAGYYLDPNCVGSPDKKCGSSD
ncbi:MAG: hypothetical protein M1835_005863, partial [Candelina submexicana]